jgi:alkylation response protein AidB-like acyl-CoA dehydrogenase
MTPSEPAPPPPPDPLAAARRLADEVLWPASGAVDAAPAIPAGHLEALAGAGLYGVLAPKELGGLGVAPGDLPEVIEVLASGCLATAFVWIQHLGLLGALLDPQTPPPLRDRLLEPVVQGRLRGGIALTGRWPGPPRLRAEPVEGGWALWGEAPWVSGWGVIDLVLVAARGPDDTVVTLVLDAAEVPGLVAHRLRLAAVDASATVRLELSGLVVAAERCTKVEPYDPAAFEHQGLRPNGSLALGVVRRCCALLGPSALDDHLRERRAALDAAGPDELPRLRAAAAELAVRAAAAVVVHHGSQAIVAGSPAERLSRQAAFLLVFGTRPAIKDELLALLAGTPGPPVG